MSLSHVVNPGSEASDLKDLFDALDMDFSGTVPVMQKAATDRGKEGGKDSFKLSSMHDHCRRFSFSEFVEGTLHLQSLAFHCISSAGPWARATVGPFGQDWRPSEGLTRPMTDGMMGAGRRSSGALKPGAARLRFWKRCPALPGHLARWSRTADVTKRCAPGNGNE